MNAHLFIVHFPVSVIMVGAALDLLGVALADTRLRHLAWVFLLTGAIAAFLAFVTGEGAKLAALGPGNVDITKLATHEQWGSVGTWAIIGGALLRTLWRNRYSGPLGYLNLSVALLLAAIVVMMTISGTLVRHGA